MGGSNTVVGTLSSLPSNFIDTQNKLRQWLEQIEQLLLNDKVRFGDDKLIETKKKRYKDLLEQTSEKEHIMKELNIRKNIQMKQKSTQKRRQNSELVVNCKYILESI